LHTDAGIGAEDINLSELPGGLFDQVLYVSFLADVCGDGSAFDLVGDALCALLIEICHDYGTRARSGKSAAQCATDTIRATGNNNDSILDLHGE